MNTIDTGVLYCNDNLERLVSIPDDSVDLIYLDPPFFSNRSYEVIWGDEAEVRSFEDRWEGGIQHYIGWMKPRVVEMRRVLAPHGTLYLHCDSHASHHLRIMLDDIFGANRFLNEIIWHYQTSGGAPKKTLIRNHDTIFRYSKGPNKGVTWTAPRQPWPESTLKKWQRDADGRIYHIHNDTGKRYYIDPGGKLMDDVWDITLAARSRERLGWPTQKPEELLERIIGASSIEGDVVLDPFCGCGTTVTVAERLQRRWIGIDISPTAITVIKRRMWNQNRLVPDVVDVPDTEDALRQLRPYEFQNYIINALNGSHSPKKSGDMGIDGFWFFTKDPIQVKQSDHVGRNVIDNFETAMQRSKCDTGYVVAFSFTKGAVEEVARVKTEGLNIRLIKVKEVLLQVKRPGGHLAKIGPQPEGEVLRLPPMRTANQLPTANELVASDRVATA
ncbi:MAG: DNA methyltransferase [Acidimicrobiales bacterium]